MQTQLKLATYELNLIKHIMKTTKHVLIYSGHAQSVVFPNHLKA